MTDPVRPVAPRIEIERIYQKAQSAALDWKLQSDEPCDLIEDLLVACEAYFAAAPVPCAASPADQIPDAAELRFRLRICERNLEEVQRGMLEAIRSWTPATPESYAQADDLQRLQYQVWVAVKQKVEAYVRATGEGARDAEPQIAQAVSRRKHDATDAAPVAVSLDPHRLQTMEDAAEMLWIMLANVSGGDWTQQSQDWRDAAARWRDNYFNVLARLRGEAAVRVEE